MAKHDKMTYGLIAAFVLLIVLMYNCGRDTSRHVVEKLSMDDSDDKKEQIMAQVHAFFQGATTHTLVNPPAPGYTVELVDCKPIGDSSTAEELFTCTIRVQDPANPEPRYMSIVARHDHQGNCWLESVHGMHVLNHPAGMI